MKFKELSIYLEKLEKTSSRLAITEILADLFKKTSADEIDKTTYLVLGQISAKFNSIVFNIADKMMVRVLAKAYGVDEEKVLKLYKTKGDLGETAFELVNATRHKITKDLSISEVYDRLVEVAKDAGEDSQERKVEKMASLLNALDPASSKFASRIPVGRLRLGFSDKTILDALSWAETGTKEKKIKLEAAYNILPDVGLLAKESKLYGIDKATSGVKAKMGVPIQPMLAARLNSSVEMIEKMKRVMVEPKFDGLRIQIHFKKSGFKDAVSVAANQGEVLTVKAFTRNLNETAWMFPELSEIDRYIQADEVILDSEAVGVDSARKAMADFKSTMSRRRKHDIEEFSKKVSITFKVFDIMFKNGESLVDHAYEERREILSKTIKSGQLLEVVGYKVTTDPKVITDLMQTELKEGLEGIIVKRADSNYIAGRTGWRWVKMKQKEGQRSKIADTLDLVIMGYTSGKGKRVGFGLGQFLVGVMNNGVIESITKIGTGLTDKQFVELKKRLSGLVVKQMPKEYEASRALHSTLLPDYWVQPEVVVEIAADEITVSPKHTSGYALRFPRLVTFRDDKSVDQATTIKEVEKLIKLQKI